MIEPTRGIAPRDAARTRFGSRFAHKSRDPPAPTLVTAYRDRAG
jgi:hypothetical protein